MYHIMTFNLRCNTPVDKDNAWPYRKDAVLDFIQKQKPLIIGTQEVTTDMREDLEQGLDMYETFGLPRAINDESNIILYLKDELERIDGDTFWLSKTPHIPASISFNAACVRICTWATFRFKNNKQKMFRVFNTHLDHVSEEAKQQGIALIYQKIREMNESNASPTILMGDFNATLDSHVVRFIQTMKKEAYVPYISAYDQLEKEKKITTFHGFQGMTKGDPIDYIFYSPEFSVKKTVIDNKKYHHRYLSDHYPMCIFIDT